MRTPSSSRNWRPGKSERWGYLRSWPSSAAAYLSLLLLVVSLFSQCSEAASLTLASRYSELRDALDKRFPGRGVTDYPGNFVHDVPKGYAMILKAELIAAGGGNVSDIARAAAEFLLTHSDERSDGFPGWGVPLAWDPYGDGSINPEHTKYTISTAIVIDALLDWLEADRAAPRAEVLRLVRGSLLPYLEAGALSPSGLLPYSLEAVDRPYDTFNPAGYLAGAMQRYSGLEPDVDLKARIRGVADRTIAAHLAHRQTAASGAWYWHYSVTEKVPNDLAHAGYIIHGLRLYAEHGGALADKLDIPAIERHLADFVEPKTQRIVAWPSFRKDTNTPARSYDLGMGLYLACLRGHTSLYAPYLASLPDYRNAQGGYLKYPPRPGQPDLAVREYEAYVLLGMATCLKGNR